MGAPHEQEHGAGVTVPRPRTVWVAMDDEQLGEIIREALSSEGYGVLLPEEEGQSRRLPSGDTPVGLALLDFRPGDTLLEELRQHPVHGGVRVILCIPYPFSAPPGADGLLHMPFNLETLLRMVAAHLR